MKSKYILLYYLDALDKYRDDPCRVNKDRLLEAECDARSKVGLSSDHLDELYKGR